MAQGIDFTALIRGGQMADTANWANIRRMQEQDQYAIIREEALAKQTTARQGREASSYLSTLLPNLQAATDGGLDPVTAMINARATILNDANFKAKPPEVQTQILNGLGQTASLRMQALQAAGDTTNLQRLVAAYGGVNPVNPLGEAISTGDPMAVFNQLNERAPGSYTLSPDGKMVIDRGGTQVPLADFAAYVAAGAGTTNSGAGAYGVFQQQGQQDRTLSAAEELNKQQRQLQAGQLRAAGLDPALFGYGDVMLPATPQFTGTGDVATTTPGVTGGLSTSEAPRAAAPVVAAAAAAAATPAAVTAAPVGATTPITAPVFQQIATLVQQANGPQLDNSLATIQKQIAESQQRQAQLDAYEPQLREQLRAAAGQTYPGAQSGSSSPIFAELSKRLDDIEKERAVITQNMQMAAAIARSMVKRRQILALPGAPGAATTTTGWAQLQEGLTK